jgi:ribosomal silencing factor RsfS
MDYQRLVVLTVKLSKIVVTLLTALIEFFHVDENKAQNIVIVHLADAQHFIDELVLTSGWERSSFRTLVDERTTAKKEEF